MLRVQRTPQGWSVTGDGALEHLCHTEDSAIRYLLRVARGSSSRVEPREWVRRHADGWTQRIFLNDRAELGWEVFVWPGGGMLDRAGADDLQQARDVADDAVRKAGHMCTAECGRW